MGLFLSCREGSPGLLQGPMQATAKPLCCIFVAIALYQNGNILVKCKQVLVKCKKSGGERGQNENVRLANFRKPNGQDWERLLCTLLAFGVWFKFFIKEVKILPSPWLAKITALSRCNPCAMLFSHLECTIECFVLFRWSIYRDVQLRDTRFQSTSLISSPKKPSDPLMLSLVCLQPPAPDVH